MHYVMVIFMVIDCDDHIGWDDYDDNGQCYMTTTMMIMVNAI